MEPSFVKSVLPALSMLKVLGVQVTLRSTVVPEPTGLHDYQERYTISCDSISSLNMDGFDYKALSMKFNSQVGTLLLTGLFNGIPVTGPLTSLHRLSRVINQDELVIEGVKEFKGEHPLGIPLTVSPMVVDNAQNPECQFFASSKEDFNKLLKLLKQSFGSTNVSLVISSDANGLLEAVTDIVYQ